MTGKELAARPVGTIVKIDDEEGEIVQAGQTVHIMWPKMGTNGMTRVIDTNSKIEQGFIAWLEIE